MARNQLICTLTPTRLRSVTWCGMWYSLACGVVRYVVQSGMWRGAVCYTVWHVAWFDGGGLVREMVASSVWPSLWYDACCRWCGTVRGIEGDK